MAQALANRLFPSRNDPAGLRFRFPFNTEAVTEYGYQLQLQDLKLEWITGAYIDNSRNNQQFTLVFGETGQTLTVPANCQASLEVLGLKGDKVSIHGATTGNVDVDVVFLNYVPSSANAIWSVIAPGQISGTITVVGSVTPIPMLGGFTGPVSNAITTGGVSQTMFAAKADRRRFMIYNPASSAGQNVGGNPPEILYVNFGANAGVNDGTSFEILPGGSFDSGDGPVSNQSITVTAATAGHRFIARQM